MRREMGNGRGLVLGVFEQVRLNQGDTIQSENDSSPEQEGLGEK